MIPRKPMHIICGTDFSVHAAEAANVAAAFAGRFKGTLTLVHAVESGEVAFLEERTVEDPRKELEHKLPLKPDASATRACKSRNSLSAERRTR